MQLNTLGFFTVTNFLELVTQFVGVISITNSNLHLGPSRWNHKLEVDFLRRKERLENPEDIPYTE